MKRAGILILRHTILYFENKPKYQLYSFCFCITVNLK